MSRVADESSTAAAGASSITPAGITRANSGGVEKQYEVLSLDEPEGIKNLLLSRREFNQQGCWVYTGIITDRGYGRKSIGNRLYLVHRLSAWLWKGMPLEGDLQALHQCDNPPCFNPNHLLVGTQSENMLDMLNKGRAWTNKLTAEDVMAIRASTDSRTIVIAREYGVTTATIRDIRSRKTWKHVA